MKDNKTSQPAHEYDDNITKTMPHYHLFHQSALDLIAVACPEPAVWLDTGCGTGTFVQKAAQRFPTTRFELADPSDAMLELAREKLAGRGAGYHLAGTEYLQLPDSSLDVITAILAHQYYPDQQGRRRAARNCYRMLKTGGLYVNFESFLPTTERGREVALEVWRRAQVAGGKSEANAAKHLKRCGVEFFPATIEAGVSILKETGFAVVEVFWLSGMQYGVYGIK